MLVGQAKMTFPDQQQMRAFWRLLPALWVMAVLAGVSCNPGSRAENCEPVVHALNQRLNPGVDEEELVSVLRSMSASGNRELPPNFVTKRHATERGWRPGRDLWEVPGLRGMSIGGDRFRNREGKLPDGGRSWREADLDYKGGKRGGKRLVYSDDGRRMVTVDHYRTFTEVPACR
ncbi:MAG TPA: ribonuclease domain-containing protein [Candidatus Deferrimicrobiaceae bacterium]|nr:ribonuclease domain-containing protein [Candidatus Deferrimicrobiaceae bacterium]